MTFTTSISSALVDFIEDTHTASNPVDLQSCFDFVSKRGVKMTPAVLEQIDILFRFTTTNP